MKKECSRCKENKEFSEFTTSLDCKFGLSSVCNQCNREETKNNPRKNLRNRWNGMKKRCYEPKNNSFDRYGGRGIVVCQNWLIFDNFYEWAINNGYKQELSIDGIDNDGCYCPENCRWVDMSTQQKNKTVTKKWATRLKKNLPLAIKATQKKIYCPELNRVFSGIRKAGRELGISSSGISAVAKGGRKSAGGYTFQYHNSDPEGMKKCTNCNEYKKLGDYLKDPRGKYKVTSICIKCRKTDPKRNLLHRWRNMKRRCYDDKNNSYQNYGGRGIKICDKWLNDFESFYKWAIETGYKRKLSLDRIDNNGNYSPGNCRWSSHSTQMTNRRYTLKMHKTALISAERRRKSILCVELNMGFPSITEAANRLGLKKANVSAVLRGKAVSTGGYTFKYLKEP